MRNSTYTIIFIFCSICTRKDIQLAEIFQHPEDSRKLFLTGVNATSIQEQLEVEFSKRFTSFTILTEDVSKNFHHTYEYAGKKKVFNVIKTLERDWDHRHDIEIVKSATCELILEGENITSRHAPYKSHYVLVPAHFVLDEEECHKLLMDDSPEEAIKHKHQDLAGRSRQSQYFLQLHNPRKLLTLQPATSMFAYRHFRKSSEVKESPRHFQSFLNDTALLEIAFHELNMNGPQIIPFADLEESMNTNQIHEAKLGAILPVRNSEVLSLMAMKRVIVKVGHSTGHMIIPPRSTGKNKLLHHIQFVIDDW